MTRARHSVVSICVFALAMCVVAGLGHANVISDGDFDGLTVGTAPDMGTPAGDWVVDSAHFGEANPVYIQVVPDPRGSGNGLQIQYPIATSGYNFDATYNAFDRYAEVAADHAKTSLQVVFDTYITPYDAGAGEVPTAGPTFTMGDGRIDNSDNRGPQVRFDADGDLDVYYNSAWHTLATFTRGVWYQVRADLNLNADTYDLLIRRIPPTVSSVPGWYPLRADMPFRAPSGLTGVDRIAFGSFSDYNTGVANVDTYVDNVSVTPVFHYGYLDSAVTFEQAQSSGYQPGHTVVGVDGWTNYSGSASLSTVQDVGGNQVLAQRDPSSGDVVVYRQWENGVSSEVRVEAMVRAVRDPAQGLGDVGPQSLIYVGDSDMFSSGVGTHVAAIFGIGYESGGLRVLAHDGTGAGGWVSDFADGPTIEANEWFRLSAVLHTAENTYDIYLDDMLVLSDLGYRMDDVSLSRLAVYTNSRTPTNGGWDVDNLNMKLTPEPMTVMLLGPAVLLVARRRRRNR